jgi:hypothetical protein
MRRWLIYVELSILIIVQLAGWAMFFSSWW